MAPRTDSSAVDNEVSEGLDGLVDNDLLAVDFQAVLFFQGLGDFLGRNRTEGLSVIACLDRGLDRQLFDPLLHFSGAFQPFRRQRDVVLLLELERVQIGGRRLDP